MKMSGSGDAIWMVLEITALLFLIVAAWRLLYIPACLELFRVDLESVRRQLFLLSHTHSLDEETNAYRYVRNSAVRMSQYADRVQFLRGRVNARIYRDRLSELNELFQKYLNEVPRPEERRMLAELERSVLYCGVKHVIRTSPILLPPFLMAHIVSLVRSLPMLFNGQHAEWLASSLHPFRSIQDQEALQIRLLEWFFPAPMAVSLEDGNDEPGDQDSQPAMIKIGFRLPQGFPEGA